MLCPREETAIRALTDIAVCYLDKPAGASGGYKNQKIADYFLPAGAVWNYLPMHPCSAEREGGLLYMGKERYGSRKEGVVPLL